MSESPLTDQRPLSAGPYTDVDNRSEDYVPYLEARIEAMKRRISELERDLEYAQDDLKMWDGACSYCANPDIEDPWRHDHNGDGKFHWHHCIDPGDGLADPCANSERLERIFAELYEENKRLRGGDA